MRLLMVSGDRQVSIGERGPFHSMQREFSRWFERIDVLCPRPPQEPTVFTIHENVHFHPAACGRLGMVSYIARRGEELVREHGHELIVSHDYGWFYNGLGARKVSRRTGVPFLSEIHHVPGVPVAADAREVFDRAIARCYVRWARNKACGFRVVNSTEMPALLKGWGVRNEAIHVLPSLYIDLEVFSPRDDVEPEQDVIFVGRMVNNKGLDRIAGALAALHTSGRRATALFIGRGPERGELEKSLRRRGLDEFVRFVDWVERPEDLADAYRKSRVVVCASTCEGGPRFTVEAMACGTPAVSTRVGVMTELLEDGRCGRSCDFTTEGLASALSAVLSDEDERRAMGLRAREVAARFEYADVLEGYARGLHALAGKAVEAP